MFTFLVLFFCFTFLLYDSLKNGFFYNSKSITMKDFLLLFMLFFFFFLTMYIAIYIDYNNAINKYFVGIFEADSYRYLTEVRMFSSSPLAVNEIKGVFGDYNVTPKMGLSSLIANVNFFNVDDEYFIYSLAVILSLIISIVNYFLFKKLAVYLGVYYSWFFVLGFFIFICFPFEFYWKTRFLREIIVIPLFLGAILLLFLSFICNKKYLSYFIFYSLLIILFRAQVFFLLFLIVFLFVRSIGIKEIFVFFSLLALSVIQTISAAGVTLFRRGFYIEDLSKINYFFNVMVGFSAYLYVFLLFFSIVIGIMGKRRARGEGLPHANYFLILGVISFCYFITSSSAFRFQYPVLLFFIIQFYFYFVALKVSDKRSKLKL